MLYSVDMLNVLMTSGQQLLTETSSAAASDYPLPITMLLLVTFMGVFIGLMTIEMNSRMSSIAQRAIQQSEVFYTERKRTERLLYQMLPISVANKLIEGLVLRFFVLLKFCPLWWRFSGAVRIFENESTFVTIYTFLVTNFRSTWIKNFLVIGDSFQEHLKLEKRKLKKIFTSLVTNFRCTSSYWNKTNNLVRLVTIFRSTSNLGEIFWEIFCWLCQ